MIVGEASSGEEALRKIARANPDLVLMDIMMGGMSGLAATRKLMAIRPTRVVLVSELVSASSDLNFRALEIGALDLVRKPTVDEVASPRHVRRFCRRIRDLAEIPLVTRRRLSPTRSVSAPTPLVEAPLIMAIGASTGGPEAARSLLTALGPQLPCPVVLIQHIADGFEPGFASWLRDVAHVPVELAVEPVDLRRRVVWLAPTGAHLEIHRGRLRPVHTSPIQGVRPSVDHLFNSLAKSSLAARSIAILLTGMGRDGATGMGALRRAGAHTIAQDEASSLVYGMPRAAVEAGAAVDELPLTEIPRRVREMFGSRGPR